LKQFIKKTINIFFLFFLSGILTSCSSNYHLNNFYGKSQLVLNKVQLDRFNNYLEGEFYSHELERQVSHKPIMFAISADGTSSLLFACASSYTECSPNVQIYQVLNRYSKKLNKEMFIFSLNNKIVWSGNAYIVKGKLLEKDSHLLNNVSFDTKDNKLSNNKLYDVSISPNEGDDDFE